MKKQISEETAKELTALANLADADIDLSDIPETNAGYWADAEVGRFYKPIKQQVTVRIDADVLNWLKKTGKGYQSRLNNILRKAMQETHSSK
ncbi:MAG: BrnA antitoxin family protein [Methylomonas sp.]|jgi:uncharacterized protein (DUF4415 family)